VPVREHKGTLHEVATEVTDQADPKMIEAASVDALALGAPADQRLIDAAVPTLTTGRHHFAD